MSESKQNKSKKCTHSKTSFDYKESFEINDLGEKIDTSDWEEITEFTTIFENGCLFCTSCRKKLNPEKYSNLKD